MEKPGNETSLVSLLKCKFEVISKAAAVPKEHSRRMDLSNLLLWDTWRISNWSRWASSLFKLGESSGSSARQKRETHK